MITVSLAVTVCDNCFPVVVCDKFFTGGGCL